MAAAPWVIRQGNRGRLGKAHRLGVVQGVKIDPDEIFAAQVRGLQNLHSIGHQRLQHWAAWSWDLGKMPGINNGITAPSLWDQAVTDKFDDWADEQAEPSTTAAPVKAEGPEKEPYDARRGEMLDALMHDLGRFPAVWRRVAKVTYFWRIPEFQLAERARMGPDSFLQQLEGLLRFIER